MEPLFKVAISDLPPPKKKNMDREEEVVLLANRHTGVFSEKGLFRSES